SNELLKGLGKSDVFRCLDGSRRRGVNKVCSAVGFGRGASGQVSDTWVRRSGFVKRKSSRKRVESAAIQRKSLFDSMSNHIANSVKCDPKIKSSATSTTVPAETALPSIRSTTSRIPSARPIKVHTRPKK